MTGIYCHITRRAHGSDEQILGLARWSDLFELVATSGRKVAADLYEIAEPDGTITTYHATEALR